MSDKPALPTAVSVMTPAIDALVANNPARLPHINGGQGRWADVILGWQAQAALNLRRVADEMVSARLALAAGQPLRDLAASEFVRDRINEDPTYATGQWTATRTFNASNVGGVIPKGFRFTRNPNPNGVPIPLEAAEYVSIAPVTVNAADTTVVVPIRATRPGPHANVVFELGTGAVVTNDVVASSPLFDAVTFVPGSSVSLFAPLSCTAAGGALVFSDDDIRRIAGAQPLGQQGPTRGAIVAGSYLGTGVRRVATYEDPVLARTIAFHADASWGCDTLWQSAVLQVLQDRWAGFGCKVVTGFVQNTYIRVAATIQLRSSRLLNYTNEISDNIRTAVRNYFDSRPDWYMWRLSAIRGAVYRADPRILTCTSVAVSDRFNNVLAEPSTLAALGTGAATHYYLLGDGLNATFSAPL